MNLSMDYKEVSRHESFSSAGDLGVKIYVSLDNITDEEKKIVSDAAYDCHHKLMVSRINNDPKNIEYGKKEQELLLACFPSMIYVKKDVNPYWREYTFRPMLNVTTAKGVISIWWRKRVIEIDWSDSDVHDLASTLFPNEDVTKCEYSIHAWSYDKAKEYIKKILES